MPLISLLRASGALHRLPDGLRLHELLDGYICHWRDCPFADALSPSLLKHLLKAEGVHGRMTVSPTARLHAVRPRPRHRDRMDPQLPEQILVRRLRLPMGERARRGHAAAAAKGEKPVAALRCRWTHCRLRESGRVSVDALPTSGEWKGSKPSVMPTHGHTSATRNRRPAFCLACHAQIWFGTNTPCGGAYRAPTSSLGEGGFEMVLSLTQWAEDCHLMAPPCTYSSFFNRDKQGVSPFRCFR